MKFDTAFIDKTKIETAICEQDNSYFLKILPIIYADNRKPRLPRKSSKQTNLQKDTNFVFEQSFKDLTHEPDETARYKVNIMIYKSNDKLGGGDLDNYCKAILDGITSTKKVWKDDKQVDELIVKRVLTDNSLSYIELRISVLN